MDFVFCWCIGNQSLERFWVLALNEALTHAAFTYKDVFPPLAKILVERPQVQTSVCVKSLEPW